jgi:hypothetical protein
VKSSHFFMIEGVERDGGATSHSGGRNWRIFLLILTEFRYTTLLFIYAHTAYLRFFLAFSSARRLSKGRLWRIASYILAEKK